MIYLDPATIKAILDTRNARITAALYGTLGEDASHVTGEDPEPPALPCDLCGALPTNGRTWQIGEALTHYWKEHS